MIAAEAPRDFGQLGLEYDLYNDDELESDPTYRNFAVMSSPSIGFMSTI